MKNKPQRLANNAPAAVVPLHGQQAGQIEPPEGWTLQTPFGHQAFRQGDDGRLVRLAELVRFLELRRGLPRAAAVRALCESMPEDVMGWLYRLQAGNFAQAVDAGETIKGRFRISAAHLIRGRGQVADAPGPAPGRESLLVAIAKEWGSEATRGRGRDDALDDVRDPLNALAVPHGRAFEVWGWGSSHGAATEMVSAPARVLVKDQKPEWTGKRIHDRIGELEKRGHPSPVSAVVAEVGLSAREVNRRKSDYLKASASPIGSMAAGLQGRNKTGT